MLFLATSRKLLFPDYLLLLIAITQYNIMISPIVPRVVSTQFKFSRVRKVERAKSQTLGIKFGAFLIMSS
jgi:hypothetical protein